MAWGSKSGGRKAGTPNKTTEDVRQKLARLGCDAIEGLATIAENKLSCGVCRGNGRTRYNLPENQRPDCEESKCLENRARDMPDPVFWCDWCSNTGAKMIGLRTCESCHGDLFEACSPELRGKMYAELAQYIETKRKAVEVTGADGGPIQHEIVAALNAGRERVAKFREEKS